MWPRFFLRELVASQGLEPNKQNQNLRCYHYTTRQSPFFPDWRGRRGSNPQPPDRQSSALTNCATTPLLRKVMCSIAYFPAPAQGGVFDFSCGRDLAPPLRGNRWPLATPTDPNRLYASLLDPTQPLLNRYSTTTIFPTTTQPLSNPDNHREPQPIHNRP